MAPLTRADVDVPGGLSTTVYRGGSGPPLVFLHSAAGLTAADPLVTALADAFAVLAPVHPGFSDLAELDDLRDIHDLALYFDDLFGVLALDSATVMGHSLGAMFAAELAAHVPHRVARLVLVAPLGLWNPAYPVADLFAAFPMGIGELLWSDPASPAAQGLAAATASAVGGAEGENPMLAAIIGLLQGLTAAGKFLWPLPDKGLDRRLRRITADTLVVWGAEDKLAPPRYAADFARAIAGAKVEMVAGAGHMVPYERQDEVIDLVRSFLA